MLLLVVLTTLRPSKKSRLFWTCSLHPVIINPGDRAGHILTLSGSHLGSASALLFTVSALTDFS